MGSWLTIGLTSVDTVSDQFLFQLPVLAHSQAAALKTGAGGLRSSALGGGGLSCALAAGGGSGPVPTAMAQSPRLGGSGNGRAADSWGSSSSSSSSSSGEVSMREWAPTQGRGGEC
jgi:hypothetical protein